MRLRKQLNIDNTYRVLNLNFFPKERKNLIKVTTANQVQVKESLKHNHGRDYYYLIDQQKDYDFILNQLVYASEGHIIYYSREIIPIGVFMDIGTNRKVTYLYQLQNFSHELLRNITTASTVANVGIYSGHIKKGVNPYSYIFKVNDVRFIADQLYLDFDKNVSLEEKEDFFGATHEILARWTIQLHMSYNSPEEKQQLKADILKKYN